MNPSRWVLIAQPTKVAWKNYFLYQKMTRRKVRKPRNASHRTFMTQMNTPWIDYQWMRTYMKTLSSHHQILGKGLQQKSTSMIPIMPDALQQHNPCSCPKRAQSGMWPETAMQYKHRHSINKWQTCHVTSAKQNYASVNPPYRSGIEIVEM